MRSMDRAQCHRALADYQGFCGSVDALMKKREHEVSASCQRNSSQLSTGTHSSCMLNALLKNMLWGTVYCSIFTGFWGILLNPWTKCRCTVFDVLQMVILWWRLIPVCIIRNDSESLLSLIWKTIVMLLELDSVCCTKEHKQIPSERHFLSLWVWQWNLLISEGLMTPQWQIITVNDCVHKVH